MSDEPVIASKSAVALDVAAGETYYYCTCGRSATQPLCDGSHSGTSFAPQAFTAEKTETVYLCGCKHTKTAPVCDGSHNKL
ncbi:MAG: CDGSH iron-sulfur domain-containing protein [Methylococcales bacterium]|jgi:CDGSH iron-sulfur domain-containing protein 3|nr:CDGSH iron-sulfur domain-containing protein [Methylococcales bacterium]MBT7445285.1 CDGSH iron-sulfur domain-containing protein [Methylococcales bacterium]